MHIAVDALGGDNAPAEIIAGTIAASKRLGGVRFSLVGDEEALSSPSLDNPPENISLKESGGVVSMDEEPSAVLRARPDASVAVAARMVREGDADAFFSAGNTGATVAAALLGIGRLKGCRRPAIATFLPFSHPVILLDAGATIACRPQDLRNFAILGSVFARRYFGLDREVRVGVINVGEEPGKGNEVTKEAHAMIGSLDGGRYGLDFVGNVEGRDIGTGAADVLVTDGFTGNVVLKTAEGTANALFGMIRSAVSDGSPVTKLAGAAIRPSLRGVRDRVDPENYGGSFLLGVNGSVVIGHGVSEARGVENALLGIERTGAGLTDALQGAITLSNSEGDSR